VEPLPAIPISQEGARGTLRHDDRPVMADCQLVERGAGVVVADRDHELVLVRRQDRSEREDVGRERVCGSGVEDRERAAVPCRVEGTEDRGGGDLVVGEDDIGLPDQRPVIGVELEHGIRARGHGDLVLAARPDDDERHTRRLAVDATDPRHVDPLGLECRDPVVAVLVGTDGRDHRDTRPGAGCRDRGIGTLSAVMNGEAAAEHRLAGRRKVVGRDDEVDVERTDDDDVPSHVGESTAAAGASATNRPRPAGTRRDREGGPDGSPTARSSADR